MARKKTKHVPSKVEGTKDIKQKPKGQSTGISMSPEQVMANLLEKEPEG